MQGSREREEIETISKDSRKPKQLSGESKSSMETKLIKTRESAQHTKMPIISMPLGAYRPGKIRGSFKGSFSILDPNVVFLVLSSYWPLFTAGSTPVVEPIVPICLFCSASERRNYGDHQPSYARDRLEAEKLVPS